MSPHRSTSTAAGPIASLGLCVLLLAVPLLRSNGAARFGAAAALAAMGVALALSVRRVRRVEHGDDASPPGAADSVREALAGTTPYFSATAVFLALVLVAAARPARAGGRDPSWLPSLLASGAALALVVALVVAARMHWRKGGLERQVFLESTCVAFFAVIVASGAYALFQVLAEAPPVSMWFVWGLGMVTWAVTSVVRTRAIG